MEQDYVVSYRKSVSEHVSVGWSVLIEDSINNSGHEDLNF